MTAVLTCSCSAQLNLSQLDAKALSHLSPSRPRYSMLPSFSHAPRLRSHNRSPPRAPPMRHNLRRQLRPLRSPRQPRPPYSSRPRPPALVHLPSVYTTANRVALPITLRFDSRHQFFVTSRTVTCTVVSVIPYMFTSCGRLVCRSDQLARLSSPALHRRRSPNARQAARAALCCSSTNSNCRNAEEFD